ncbi:DNA repair protein RadA [Scrofimicrobium sp. R131]|uniref:DNA repair protein RadA n=1 Tax=Scrofimicrobium appendicitidis TaxID=3079930 RepID=A0AAU7V679_9ACTO
MAKTKVVHVCEECGWESPKWLGQCRSCGAWGTLTEARIGPPAPGSSLPALATAAVPVTEVDIREAAAFPSGISEFDRVLGRGITPGGIILLAGDPGVGKSTLLLDIAARFARMAEADGRGPVLYATGEETASQVRLRAERIGALTPHLLLVAENNFQAVAAHAAEHRPSLLIVDSVQTLTVPEADGVPGGVTQIREVTTAVIRVAKEQNLPAILVGHVTKEGGLAGPRSLEHLVDVVCHFEGDRHTGLRLLRSLKNRYGSTDEVGCFQLTDRGVEEVPDPSSLFVSNHERQVEGSAIAITLDGQRALPTEVQALAQEGPGGNGRRTVSGLNHSRVAMILAVLQAKVGIGSREEDVYVSTVGGAVATEPATDLAIALAFASAKRGEAVRPRLVAIGEVGLTGDIRGCHGLERRLAEAQRLGYREALVPSSQVQDLRAPRNLQLIPVGELSEAINFALKID